MEYTAFISYRRSDGTRTANWLRGALQSFRPPRSLRERHGKPVRIFLDTAYERGADDFYERTIRPALLASRHLIVLATPDAAARGGRIEDDWMAREIADFGAGPNAGNLIVVRAAGAFDGPLPGNLAETYPNAQIIDLRGATDWSPLNLGRKAFFDNEKLKIAASLLDIPLEDMPLLRREEERKRQARIGLLAGLAAAVVVMSVGVSVYSVRAQFFGQRSIEQSLSEAESALKRIARLHWDDNAFLRPRDHAIGAMCEVARRLAVEASLSRDAEARAICDLEYLLPYAVNGDISDEQRAFAVKEFERLVSAAQALRPGMVESARSGSAEPEPSASASRLGFAIRVNQSEFLGLGPDQAFAAERAEYLPPIRAAVEVARSAGEAVGAAGAGRTAREWLALAIQRYGEQLRSDHAESFDPAGEGLAALSDLAHAVRALPRPPPPPPDGEATGDAEPDGAGDDLAWVFETLHLIGTVVAEQSLDEPDIVAARRGLGVASAALEALTPESAAPRAARTTLDGWRIALAEAVGNGQETDAFGRYDRLSAIMDEAQANKARFAATAGGDETNSSAAFDRFLRQLGNELHLSLDAVQGHARKRADGGDPAGALELLGECQSRREALYRHTHDGSEWPRVFLLASEIDLIGYQAAARDEEGAEARRIAQWRKVQARPLDRSDLGAVDATRYDEAVDALARGHHAYLDDLRARASALQEKGDHRPAAAVLGTLLKVDRDWDLLKSRPSEFDRVYAGEVSLQLADSLEKAGDFDTASRTRLRAIRELAPLARQHNLSGSELERAQAVWKRASDWGNASGVRIAELEPIETLEAF